MADGNAESNTALASALETGAYSDLTIRCGQYEAKVHKVILCTRSEYFARALEPGKFKEGKDGIITLRASTDTDTDPQDVSIDDPEAIRLMVVFIYTHDYEANAIGRDLVMHARMYSLGSKYSIKSLQVASLAKFSDEITDGWSDEDLPEALRWVYTATLDNDKGLRDVATKALLEHQDVLLAKPEIETCIRDIPGLAFDLLKAKPPTKPDIGGPCCNTCGTASAELCASCRKAIITCSCMERTQARPAHGYSGMYWFCNNCR